MLIFFVILDFVIGVFVILNVIFLMLNNFLVGGYICKVCMFVEYMVVVVYIFIIIVLVLDRFLVIWFLMKFRIFKRWENYLFVIGVIMFFFFLYGFCGFFLYQLVEKEMIKGNIIEIMYMCMVFDNIFNIYFGFVVVDFILLFIFLFLVFIIFNVKVFKILRRILF